MKRPKSKLEAGGDEPISVSEARRTAIGILARREHAALELYRKLTARGISHDVAESVLTALSREGLQSDERFVESYVRARVERGYGPVRIRVELRERGISNELIGTELETADGAWAERAETVRRKRFGAKLPEAWKERARQARFLQYRGFSAEQVHQILGH